MSRASKRLALAAVLVLVGAWGLLPSPAAAMTLTAHTNRGGTCRLHTTASRSGTQITYGVRVKDCSTHFGVRYAVSRGILYDKTDDGLPVANGYMDHKKGHLPYANHRTVDSTQTSHTYRTRIDISVVLKTHRDSSTPHPERWIDSKRCRVKTTWHNGDTLGCELGDTL